LTTPTGMGPHVKAWCSIIMHYITYYGKLYPWQRIYDVNNAHRRHHCGGYVVIQ